jgi:hypothetical protein
MVPPQAKLIFNSNTGRSGSRDSEDSCKLKAINGLSALSCIADYTVHGQNMVEYQTRVRSENTNAFLFARMRAEQLDDFKTRMAPIGETLQMQ